MGYVCIVANTMEVPGPVTMMIVSLARADRQACWPMPLAPMLPSPAPPFHRPGWIYEEKYDGWRCLAYKRSGLVRLLSRNGIDCRALSDRRRSLSETRAQASVRRRLAGECQRGQRFSRSRRLSPRSSEVFSRPPRSAREHRCLDG